MFDLVIVGGGNMGAALLGGLLESGVVERSGVAVVEVLDTRRVELATMFPGLAVVDVIPSTRSAVLAVKPGDIPSAAAAAAAAGATRLLSIAAGVRLATIEGAARDGAARDGGARDGGAGAAVAVVRAMPNTPALVGLGASAIAPGATADRGDVAWAATILGAVGTVDEMSEPELDLFTGLAGSGPAYLFLVAEALTEAAVSEGMTRDVAERVVRQLLLGSATLLARDGNPRLLRERVTSPGGTTAAGLEALDRFRVRDAFTAAVRAATERSRELG